MNTFKNCLIALLTGLLVLTLTTQPSIGAGKSKEVKMIEYDNCLKMASVPSIDDAKYFTIKAINQCKMFQP
jgi:hypothetical protein